VREWDSVTALELPELEGTTFSELSLKVLRDGTVLGDLDGVSGELVERLAWLARDDAGLPAELRAVRTGVRDWSVAVRRLRLELLDLPDVDAAELSLAIAPDGERTLIVDGEEAVPVGALAEAARELESRGRERHAAFVARATRSSGGWALTVDPL
jgi:hypothetical protein